MFILIIVVHWQLVSQESLYFLRYILHFHYHFIMKNVYLMMHPWWLRMALKIQSFLQTVVTGFLNWAYHISNSHC
ncbi:hypothetical protein SS53_23805 [Enterobacter hormaechei subsp. steigerwaltii]|nr:hypothetical protein SS53_23805 [Enterobacter hormaechei subsp. steigerwaltii]KNN32731.1 hypothetical protein AEV14_05880 [Salmonella enterica subsp. enterica serovar Brandenburg]KNW44657.1 hypothetical protein AEX17_03930 [Salmonella enterica subsp. enterica serovar Heidelberg]KJN41836.1 hypothetical protein SS40_22880 [Enterobacter hormaechei subsp. steigerwaltii]KOK79743.1 hypothetical protein AEW96_10935 [Salmonella enterica subsp. enterica serovar Heidelberg]